MLSDCSEEEIVSIVRKRERYSLTRAMWAERYPRLILEVNLALLLLAAITSILELKGVGVKILYIATILSYGYLIRRIWKKCRKDGISLLKRLTSSSK